MKCVSISVPFVASITTVQTIKLPPPLATASYLIYWCSYRSSMGMGAWWIVCHLGQTMFIILVCLTHSQGQEGLKLVSPSHTHTHTHLLYGNKQMNHTTINSLVVKLQYAHNNRFLKYQVNKHHALTYVNKLFESTFITFVQVHVTIIQWMPLVSFSLFAPRITIVLWPVG